MVDWKRAAEARRRETEEKERKARARQDAVEQMQRTEAERARMLTAADQIEFVYRALKIMLPAIRKHMDHHAIAKLRELSQGTDFDPKHVLDLGSQMDLEDRKDPQAGKIRPER